jgi:hypothetical protein
LRNLFHADRPLLIFRGGRCISCLDIIRMWGVNRFTGPHSNSFGNLGWSLFLLSSYEYGTLSQCQCDRHKSASGTLFPLFSSCLVLKRQSHEIFDFRFFHESSDPGILIIPLRPFDFFSVKSVKILAAQAAASILKEQ